MVGYRAAANLVANQVKIYDQDRFSNYHPVWSLSKDQLIFGYYLALYLLIAMNALRGLVDE